MTWHEKDNTVRYNNAFNVYVQGIPSNVKPREIYEHFHKFGEIQSAKINENEFGVHNGYAYINYNN